VCDGGEKVSPKRRVSVERRKMLEEDGSIVEMRNGIKMCGKWT
jgi:hypothetical protein